MATHYKNNCITNIQDEEWRAVEQYPLYEVSNLGRIRRQKASFKTKRGTYKQHMPKIMRQNLNERGYCVVHLRDGIKERKTVTVHRLIAIAWIPNPLNKATVNHKKGIKYDNQVSELEWATQQEQSDHAIAFGLIPKINRGYWKGRFGKDAANSKKINQFSLDGDFIKTWDSLSDVERDLGIDGLSAACAEKIGRAGLFQWRYFDNEKIKSVGRYIDTGLKPVKQYSLSAKFIREWASSIEAGKQFKCTGTSIRACCTGKEGSAFGFFWQNSYIGDTLIINDKIKAVINKNKPINQYNFNGDLINKWGNINELRLSFGSGSSIYHCCMGQRPSAFGYFWQYSEKGEDLILTPQIKRKIKKGVAV